MSGTDVLPSSRPGPTRAPAADVAFASKAFPCTAVQRLMVEEGLHLDVAGGGEIVTALAAGADPARLVLHGNAKTDEELELAVRSGVGLVVVDDVDRLERIVPRGHTQACLVRVIPGVDASGPPSCVRCRPAPPPVRRAVRPTSPTRACGS